MSEFTEAQSNQTKGHRSIALLKIIVLTGIPLMAFVGVAITSLLEAHWGMEHTDQMESIGSNMIQIRKVIATLQRERAARCLYYGSDNR